MSEVDHARLDRLRRGHGPVGEHVIDEFVAGRLSRRQFLSRATKVGLGLPVAAAIVAACGSNASKTSNSSATGPSSSSGSAKAGKPGGTIRAGMVVPAGAINPLTINDTGGLEVLDQVGESLVHIDHNLVYHPLLATSWSTNPDGSVWTFKIRQNAKFNDGTPMTVDDVVYTFKSQANPKLGVNAASIFGGTLSPAGVVKKDSETIEFHLEAPDGGFVDACSQDNYNTTIVPDNFDFTKFQQTMPGTGKFKMTSYSPTVGAAFVKNPYYWGAPAKPDKLEVTFFASEAPMTAALEAGTIMCNDGFSVAVSPQLLSGGFDLVAAKAAQHRELSMRCDIGPFADARVRRAMALTLNRPQIVHALFKGYATIGNDSPFAPIYPATNHSVPQRHQDIAQARQLMAQAGKSRGFAVTLASEQLEEMPEYATIIKAAAAHINIDITLSVTTSSIYYGAGVFGKSPWLDATMSLVDYGGRGVPNIYLEAPLQTIDNATGQGAWNAAHFNNATYDRLSKQFIAASDLSTQRRLAGEIETLLLDETPIIYAYFYDVLLAQKGVTGVDLTQQGNIYYYDATLT
ncbi:MAG: ABC transporter substrate-binding protein [Actinomycetota bacterium]|jgi:peptide/nickel transport system substrate-binding protein|nr:ABC transporter substrate-binding protein [Actinomycetota bacterium]